MRRPCVKALVTEDDGLMMLNPFTLCIHAFAVDPRYDGTQDRL